MENDEEQKIVVPRPPEIANDSGTRTRVEKAKETLLLAESNDKPTKPVVVPRPPADDGDKGDRTQAAPRRR